MQLRPYLGAAKRRLRKLQALGIPTVKPDIMGTVPHDPDAFTQGLCLHQGKLYESTGLTGRSSLRRIDCDSGRIEALLPVEDVFAEGIGLLGQRLYQLTWKSGVVYVYDLASLELIETLALDGPGWGMCSAAGQLAVSNGSSVISFRDAHLTPVKAVRLRMNGLPLSLINDLAVYRDKVYFNVYKHTRIYEADLDSGRIVRVFELDDIVKKEQGQQRFAGRPDHKMNAILNGIAIEEQSGVAWITGKLWGSYYRFNLD